MRGAQWRKYMNQSWAEFRTEFTRAQHEQRIIINTASGTGYHTFNMDGNYIHGQLPENVMLETAMANLALPLLQTMKEPSRSNLLQKMCLPRTKMRRSNT
jgi:hypothetical protein